MKNSHKLSYHLLLLSWFFVSTVFGTDGESKKPYNHALIMGGMNIDTPIFIGQYDAHEEMDKPIDLVIGICGGSLGAALIEVFPNKEKRLNFLKSVEYWNFLNSIKFSEISVANFYGYVNEFHRASSRQRVAFSALEELSAKKDQFGPHIAWRMYKQEIPNIFDLSLIKIPVEGINLPFFNTLFQSKERSEKRTSDVLITATRVEYLPSEVGRKRNHDEKLFTQVIFGHTELLKRLENVRSFAAQMAPYSALNFYYEVLPNITIAQATRASIADPYLILPAKINGRLFVTGATNIDPIPLAHFLANEVTARFSGDWDPVLEEPVLRSVFYFDPNKLRREMNYHPGINYWMDFINNENFPGFNLGPKIDFSRGPNHFLYLEDDVSTSHQEFVKRVMEQYEYGKKLAKQALRNKGSRKHIETKLK